MTGDRVAAFARRITREATFEQVVSPAVADLQHEASGPGSSRLRGYAGVLRALTGAIVVDVAEDLRVVFGAEARQRVWPVAAVTMVVALVVRTAIQWLGAGQDALTLALRQPDFFAMTLPAMMLPAAAALRRARAARRAVVVLAVLVGLLTAGTWLTVVPAAQRMGAAYSRTRAPLSDLVPLTALPAATQARVLAGAHAAGDAARHAPFAFAMAVVGYALLGWSLAGIPTVLMVGATVDLAVMQSFFVNAHSASGASAPWTPAVGLVVLGLLARWVRAEMQDDRLTLRPG